jgi:hypothetical protein
VTDEPVDLVLMHADDVRLDLLAAGHPPDDDDDPLTHLLAAWRDACRRTTEEDASWLSA